MFYDLDGTLTKNFQDSLGISLNKATLTPYFVHNDI